LKGDDHEWYIFQNLVDQTKYLNKWEKKIKLWMSKIELINEEMMKGERWKVRERIEWPCQLRFEFGEQYSENSPNDMVWDPW
jgi:hypothetical protein